MAKGFNNKRSNETIRMKISQIIATGISDPRLDLITVTDTELSPDKGVCKVYISCAAERYEEVSAGLARANGAIRSQLSRTLEWRTTPELRFYIDTTVDEADRIEKALQDRPKFIDIPKDEFGYPIEENNASE